MISADKLQPLHVCAHVYMCMFICVYTYLGKERESIYAYVYKYAFIYKETERQRQRERGRYTIESTYLYNAVVLSIVKELYNHHHYHF